MACPAVIGSEFLTPCVAYQNIKAFRHFFSKTISYGLEKKGITLYLGLKVNTCNNWLRVFR
jgi:hypothetical protein